MLLPNLQLMQVVKLAMHASGAILWPNLQLLQVVPCCCQIQSKSQSQFMGPLCLWQCFRTWYTFNGIQFSAESWGDQLNVVCFCAENEIAEFKIFTSRPFKIWFWIKSFSSFAFLSNFSLSVYVPAFMMILIILRVSSKARIKIALGIFCSPIWIISIGY